MFEIVAAAEPGPAAETSPVRSVIELAAKAERASICPCALLAIATIESVATIALFVALNPVNTLPITAELSNVGFG